MRPTIPTLFGLAALAFAAGAGGCAQAAAVPGSPAITLEFRDTADYLRNLQGGLSVGNTSLNKLQVAATLDGEGAGWPGFRAYVQAYVANSQSFSLARTGDIQTASNIEAPGFARLFELWVEQARGLDGQPGRAFLRAGLIDLNRSFDAIATAGLFLNSSHGIGPDLSESGRVGPSIYPTTAPSIEVGWVPVKTLTLHLGAFAEPDADRLYRFADLSVRHGVLAIGQADWTPVRDAQVSLGVWRYSSDQPSLADPAVGRAPGLGAYGFVAAPTGLPGRPSGWIRAGLADGQVQQVSSYAGAGLVWAGPGRRRDLDQFGVAVARAGIGHDARLLQGLPRAETTFEVTYSFAANGYLTLQPDFQEILHPAGAPHLRNATVVGLRLVAAAKRTRGGD